MASGIKVTNLDAKGKIISAKSTINMMVDRLNSILSEITYVARDVGSEGKLGGLDYLPTLACVRKDHADLVKQRTGNFTVQARNIAEVTTEVANGDLSKKIRVNVKSEILGCKKAINTAADQLNFLNLNNACGM